MWMGGDTDSKPDLAKLVDLEIPERDDVKYIKERYGLTDAELNKKMRRRASDGHQQIHLVG